MIVQSEVCVRKLPSTKRLTAIYLSGLALVLIVVYASIFEITREGIEHVYVNNRLNAVHQYALEYYDTRDIKEQDTLEVPLYVKQSLYHNPVYYFNWDKLPVGFPSIDEVFAGEELEFKKTKQNGQKRSFAVKYVEFPMGEIKKPAFLAIDQSLYELSESQVIDTYIKQIIVSFILLIISLFIILKVSYRLTSPVIKFAEALSSRNSDDIRPLVLPEKLPTKELAQLFNTFNTYQQRIHGLLHRERAFNRYASHELRTPLMVIQGAVTLLGESNKPQFVEKQRQRLKKATTEMIEFTETLLSLNKVVGDAELTPYYLTW